MSLTGRILSKVRRAVREFEQFQREDLVVVALSGGADSTALLHILKRIQPEYSIRLHVAHLNHCFRGRESERDADFVRDLALRMGIPATVESFNVSAFASENRLSSQDAARRVRYKFLMDVASRIGATKIAIGHTLDDQVETVLMNILYGCGVRGLRGIPGRRGEVVRPLIYMSRREIEAFLKELNVGYVEDSSNLKDIYLRNRVRHCLIPVIEELSPSFRKRISQLCEIARQEELYFEVIIDRLLEGPLCERKEGSIILSLSALFEFDLALRRRVLYRTIREMAGEECQPTFLLVDSVLNCSIPFHGEKCLYRCRGFEIIRSYDRLQIQKHKPPPAPYCYPFRVGEVKVPDVGARIKVEELPIEDFHRFKEGMESDAIYLDRAKLIPPLVLRSRRAGDRITLPGLGCKKIKDIFIDEKIPLRERDRIPIIVDSGGVVAILGSCFSSRNRVDPRAWVEIKTEGIFKIKLCFEKI